MSGILTILDFLLLMFSKFQNPSLPLPCDASRQLVPLLPLFQGHRTSPRLCINFQEVQEVSLFQY